MRVVRLWLRFFHIAIACVGAGFGYFFRRVRAGFIPAERRELLRGEALAGLLQRLGATFIKFGQILSTRPDLLGPGYITPLSRLQDAVRPASFAVVQGVLETELEPEARALIASIEPEPVAAASVAQVHRARLGDGRVAALKVQRPEAEAQIERDLAILGFGARLLDRLPTLRMLSLPGAVEHFGAALRAQLDFVLEAENNRRFKQNFANLPGVDVPELFEELCTRRVLAMEFVEGVKADQLEQVGKDRLELARLGARTVLQMVFADGFVHADLHPGNIILTPDGRVVLIDLGLVTEIPRDMLRPWVETCVALSQRDGAAAARLFYEHAPSVGRTDYAAFEQDIVAVIARFDGKQFGEVEVSDVVGSMMNVLRRHRVQIESAFTVVNIAMLVAEGLGKTLDPEIDLLTLATPYLAEAMLTAPDARAPRRERATASGQDDAR